MDSGSAPAIAKASSDELLRKFAEVGSGSTAKKELSQLAKRRRHHRKKITRENDFDDDEQYRENPSSSLSRRASLVERKSLLPAVAASTPPGCHSAAGDWDWEVKNMSIFATIDKAVCKHGVKQLTGLQRFISVNRRNICCDFGYNLKLKGLMTSEV
ncbi:hypothetical protein HYC85_025816 [Camellia sinensis]|uniref:Uncharacterized protein n=1 Tax=Camellia sinensis TaxID=4442 RepID=A0A7J7G2F5_CAMSI|nr:hypothetical protein HYC85_025816 [Camellia sinensis]